MRWLIDTSAYGRQDEPEVARQIVEILHEDATSELVLSPSVLLELLRGPQGEDVATFRGDLLDSMLVAGIDDETFEIAASAMETLAEHADEDHRRPPVADLITAALAHQHRYGVIHIDAHFELMAEHAGLNYESRQLNLPAEPARTSPATAQRALRTQLAQALHHLPIAEAEEVLREALAQAEAKRETG